MLGQVAEVERGAERELQAAIGGPAAALLDSCPPDLWPRLRRLLSASLARASQARASFGCIESPCSLRGHILRFMHA